MLGIKRRYRHNKDVEMIIKCGDDEQVCGWLFGIGLPNSCGTDDQIKGLIIKCWCDKLVKGLKNV